MRLLYSDNHGLRFSLVFFNSRAYFSPFYCYFLNFHSLFCCFHNFSDDNMAAHTDAAALGSVSVLLSAFTLVQSQHQKCKTKTVIGISTSLY